MTQEAQPPVQPPPEPPQPAKWPGNDRAEAIVGVMIGAAILLTWIAVGLR